MNDRESFGAVMQILEWVQQSLLQMPEINQWPEMVELVERLSRARSMSCLEYPVIMARAYGVEEAQALPAVAATFCALTSINLVDDMLDQDPRGDHIRWGEGVAANLAVAFQAAGFRALRQAEATAERQSAAMSALALMLMGTSYGQHLDLGDFEAEDQYWALVATKTAPLFSCALSMGAQLAGAPERDALRIQELGGFLGRIVQVNDDIADSLEKPAKPDWRSGSANLPILYSSVADHPERKRFTDLIGQVEDQQALEEAQQILVRSGAISFCLYQVVQSYRQAKEHLEKALDLPHPVFLHELLDDHLQPLKSMLTRLGIEMPAELLES